MQRRRAQQRLQTRERIIDAAVGAFAELGFRAASTRDIAARAGTTQGLVTYHFRNKDELWRAAADQLFGKLRVRLLEGPVDVASSDPKEIAREAIRQYVRFVAEHPDLFRFMVDEGKHADERMQWLVDTHLRPLYDTFRRFGESLQPVLDPAFVPHAYYVLAGASSLIFAVAPECRRLTGLDPGTKKTVETHAEVMARLLVP